jgi:signal transduction histidine kinase
VVERFGLESALRYLTHRYAHPKGLEVSLRYNAPARLDPITARAFHRITECALESALAGGQKQRITISVRELNGCVELAVESNSEQWNAGPADLERALIKHHADAAEIELNVNPSFNGGTIILARRGNSNALERN